MKRRWSNEEIEIVTTKYESGVTCREIAKLLGRTRKSVQHRVNQLGLKKPSLNVGDRVNRLIILELYNVYEHGQNKTYAKCECDCGNITKVKLTAIKQEEVKSCGCLKAEKASQRMTEYNSAFHGLSDSRLYKILAGMKNRCYNTKQYSYKDYGARGIKICDEWMSDFKAFYDWAMNHGYKDTLTIERLDVDGDYKPDNCTWITRREQAANKRNSCPIILTAFGETKNLYEWMHDERCQLKSVGALAYRVCAGWKPEDIITTPSERSK